jgi:pilus assembly protein CpaE
MANILIVDDDKDILRMLEFALKRAGHTPLTTTSGAEGLEIIKNTPPQLIIADVMMPEMTGYEFTRQVRLLPEFTQLPIVIYSARFQSIDRKTALDAGATEYMPKSATPSELIKRIDDLLGGNHEQKPTVVTNRTVAFFSLRGGSGVTTLAVNIAVVLAMSRKTQICLADFNPMAGHAGLMLNLRPHSHIFNVLPDSTQASSFEQVKQHLTPHQTGVQLLASPLMTAGNFYTYNAKGLVEALRSQFAFNVIDLPHYLSPSHLELLPLLSKLVLILSPGLPSLQSAVSAIKYLTQNKFQPEKIAVVLNKNTPVPGVSTETIEKTIRLPIVVEIPFDPAIPAAANTGQPLVLLYPKSEAAAAIARLVTRLIN